MFRTSLLRNLRAPLISSSVTRKPLRVGQGKNIELLEGYDKVDASKEITEESSYVQDLGLDSLDVVEVVMELEHEFNIQIPDNEADSLKTVGQTIDYVLSQEDSV
ncbi:hypothetical protein G9P44_001306 [Scheffersomyces stipitis]|nr:hypothetical protein G9P44_001306 [Scheffersomyces stipitis]